jgi:hypothetical protein
MKQLFLAIFIVAFTFASAQTKVKQSNEPMVLLSTDYTDLHR